MIKVTQFIDWLKENDLYDTLNDACYPDWGGVYNVLTLEPAYEEPVRSALVRGFLCCLHDEMIDAEGDFGWSWDKNAEESLNCFIEAMHDVVDEIEENGLEDMLSEELDKAGRGRQF